MSLPRSWEGGRGGRKRAVADRRPDDRMESQFRCLTHYMTVNLSFQINTIATLRIIAGS